MREDDGIAKGFKCLSRVVSGIKFQWNPIVVNKHVKLFFRDVRGHGLTDVSRGIGSRACDQTMSVNLKVDKMISAKVFMDVNRAVQRQMIRLRTSQTHDFRTNAENAPFSVEVGLNP